MSLGDSISNVLREYSVDLLFNEFLQNADDALATEFAVSIDETTYGSDYLFDKALAPFQGTQVECAGSIIFCREQLFSGPSLMVYNNAKFTEKDFKAIQALGSGAKRSAGDKIGKFGIGFNVAFHLTDLPSIASNDRTFRFFLAK